MTIYSPEEHFRWGSGQYSKVEVTNDHILTGGTFRVGQWSV